MGEGRACWSLGNAYVSLGSHEQALHFARKHLEISQEVREAGSDQSELVPPVERKTLFYAKKFYYSSFSLAITALESPCLCAVSVESLGTAELGWEIFS